MTGGIFWGCVALILYTYAGYPLLVGALAQLRRQRPHRRAIGWPTVTLLIAAYNEEDAINDKLKNSLATDYPGDRLQILVVEDGSDDATAAIVRQWTPRGVELISGPTRSGKSAAITSAVPLARGSIVVFSDANNFYEPATLPTLVSHFADPSVGAVTGLKCITGGPTALSVGEGFYGRYESFIRRQEARLGCCTSVNGEILAVRRELLEPIPPDVINDDFWIAMRIARRGFRIAYEPEARSWETTSETAADEVARRTRMVAGRYQAIARAPMLLSWRRPLVAWQVVSHKFLRPLVPFAAGGALASAVLATLRPNRRGGRPVLTLAKPWNWAALLGQVGFFVLAAIGARSGPTPGATRVLSIARFLVQSNHAAAKGFAAYLRGGGAHWQRVRRAPEPVSNPTTLAGRIDTDVVT